MRLSVILLGLLAGLVSCSSAEPQSDPYGTPAQFCEEWAKAACQPTVASACSGEDASPATERACVLSQAAFCEKLLPPAGYDSKYAGDCLGAVANAYADGKLTASEVATVRRRAAPCDRMIRGARGKGESCTTNDECDTLSDYTCVRKGDTSTCQIPTPVQNGDPCGAAEATCNPGYYCSDNCVKQKVMGDRCTTDVECAAGLLCSPGTSKCATRMTGASCAEDAECPLEKVCDIPIGSPTGMCVSTITLGATTAICEDLR